MGFPSSDMAFWDHFGIQMRGRALAESSQNGRSLGFHRNSNFEQPSDDFSWFREPRRRINRCQGRYFQGSNGNQNKGKPKKLIFVRWRLLCQKWHGFKGGGSGGGGTFLGGQFNTT